MNFLYHSLILLALFSIKTNVHAQNSIENSKNTLNTISEFANKICADPAYSGSNTSENAGAKAKVELLSLIKKLIDAKVEIGADYKRQEYTGLLQKDLLEATKNAATCRLTIAKDLADRLLPKKNEIRAIQKIQSPKLKNNTSEKIEPPKNNKKDDDLKKDTPVNQKSELMPKELEKKNDTEKSPVNTSATNPPIKLATNDEHQIFQIRDEVKNAISALNGTSIGYRTDAILALLSSLPDNLNANEITLILGDETIGYRTDNLRLLLRKTKANSLESNKINLILKNEMISYRVDMIKLIYPYIKSPIHAEDVVGILSSLSDSYRVDALSHITSKIAKPLNNFEVDSILKNISYPYKSDGIKALFK